MTPSGPSQQHSQKQLEEIKQRPGTASEILTPQGKKPYIKAFCP